MLAQAAEDPWPDTIVNVREDEGVLRASLPESVLAEDFSAMRKFVDTPGRFRIRLANDEGRRSLASYLVSKRYGWRGYTAGPIRMTPDQITLIASDDERALATISVGFDRDAGLLADSLYPDEVAGLRAQGARLCEFTKLAVEPGKHSQEVLAMLFHIAYIYARRINRCTELLIEVNPRHVRFYESALGFERLGPQRICPRVDAPAVLLRLDLSHCEQELARVGGHRKMAGRIRSLYPLGFSPREEEGIHARLFQLG
ncbi:N-acyl amino acid synthase FeeM domain-containing protein [Zeimonas arvi]|nr:hypothetical protein [Zeimonas arvi]